MNTVCAYCIDEEFLHNQIMESGQVAYCEFCHSNTSPTIELDELAEQVHSVLQEHFYMTSSEPEGVDRLLAKEGYWEQPGEPITYAIMNLIGSSEELAESVREHLSCQYDPAGKDALIDPCPYASESQYEERPIDTYEFQESWASFRREILSRARFFNQAAKSALEHLFSNIEQLCTYNGSPVVRILSPTASIYRARVAKTPNELENILKNVPSSLSAPPGCYAKAGRMNAEGISVFYGAIDIDTCIAEIRAPVGSYVVSGSFSPVRELRLLDLTRLRSVFFRGSLFDSAHTEAMSRVHFLRRLEAELSQPVMPGAESRDYLPTQVVAEYLGSHPDMGLDGVMFSSTQVTPLDDATPACEEQETGKNVVLFTHACGLEDYEIPDGAEVDVRYHQGDSDDPDHSIWICENVPDRAEQVKKVDPNDVGFDWRDVVHPSEFMGEGFTPSIRLDIESIEVRKISGVSYQTSSFYVSRYRAESKNVDC